MTRECFGSPVSQKKTNETSPRLPASEKNEIEMYNKAHITVMSGCLKFMDKKLLNIYKFPLKT